MTLLLKKRTKMYASACMVMLTTFISMGPAYAGGSVNLSNSDMAVGTLITGNSAVAPPGYKVSSVVSLSPAIADVVGLSGIGSSEAKFDVEGVAANQSAAEIKATFISDAPGEAPDSASAFETVVEVVSIQHKNSVKNKEIGDQLTKKDFNIKTFPTGYQNRNYVQLSPDPWTIIIGENNYMAVCGSSKAYGSFTAAVIDASWSNFYSAGLSKDEMEYTITVDGADGTFITEGDIIIGGKTSGNLNNGETFIDKVDIEEAVAPPVVALNNPQTNFEIVNYQNFCTYGFNRIPVVENVELINANPFLILAVITLLVTLGCLIVAGTSAVNDTIYNGSASCAPENEVLKINEMNLPPICKPSKVSSKLQAKIAGTPRYALGAHRYTLNPHLTITLGAPSVGFVEDKDTGEKFFVDQKVQAHNAVDITQGEEICSKTWSEIGESDKEALDGWAWLSIDNKAWNKAEQKITGWFHK